MRACCVSKCLQPSRCCCCSSSIYQLTTSTTTHNIRKEMAWATAAGSQNFRRTDPHRRRYPRSSLDLEKRQICKPWKTLTNKTLTHNQMDFQWQIHHILNYLIQGFARFGNCKGVDFIMSQVASICCQSNWCRQQITSHPPPLPSFLFLPKLCRWLNFILCNVTLHLNASHIALCHLNFSFCCCESTQIFIHHFIKNYHFS